jgi:hypothetical protein
MDEIVNALRQMVAEPPKEINTRAALASAADAICQSMDIEPSVIDPGNEADDAHDHEHVPPCPPESAFEIFYPRGGAGRTRDDGTDA